MLTVLIFSNDEGNPLVSSVHMMLILNQIYAETMDDVCVFNPKSAITACWGGGGATKELCGVIPLGIVPNNIVWTNT